MPIVSTTRTINAVRSSGPDNRMTSSSYSYQHEGSPYNQGSNNYVQVSRTNYPNTATDPYSSANRYQTSSNSYSNNSTNYGFINTPPRNIAGGIKSHEQQQSRGWESDVVPTNIRGVHSGASRSPTTNYSYSSSSNIGYDPNSSGFRTTNYSYTRTTGGSGGSSGYKGDLYLSDNLLGGFDLPPRTQTIRSRDNFDTRGGGTTPNPTSSHTDNSKAPAASRFTTPRGEAIRSQNEVTAPDSGKSPHIPKPATTGGKQADQAYDNLRSKLIASGALYEDKEFPATDASLFYSNRLPFRPEWKRPHEICQNPMFEIGGASSFDVIQGQLGDCWLLAAVASLSLHKELFTRVVPPGQNFNRGDYCGMFRFRFWRFGEWQEVLVDDRLPTYRGELIYMHSSEKSEFWSALLEKAYAKLFGNYELLSGGSQSEAMEDFTGGICEMFEMKTEVPADLFETLQRAHKKSSLMGCSIDADPYQVEAKMSNGLIKGHAYSVTSVQKVQTSRLGTVRLVRVRNPWGNEAEWKGAWGDKSREWSMISDSEKVMLGITFEDDGEFWMSYEDFTRNFEKLEICHLGPQSMDGQELRGTRRRRWEMTTENGAWKRRLNAGGCRNFIDTFWTNPQYRVTVVDPDEEDDENKGTIIVGLMQKNMRKRKREGIDFYTIGYSIYALGAQDTGPLDIKFFKYNRSVDKSPYINLREVCSRHKLTPGDYVIVPSTFDPDEEAEFLLRIFSEKPSISGELDEETEMVDTKPKDVVPENDNQVEALREAFASISGEDMEVDATELKNILDSTFKQDFKFDGFGIETARSMVALMDIDQSGKLGFEEFKILWADLRLWKTIFKNFDYDKSGNLNSYELRQALNAVGFKISNSVFNCLVMRYSQKSGIVLFDDFIMICARLKTIFETFKAQKKTPAGEAAFDKDTFIQCLMYA